MRYWKAGIFFLVALLIQTSLLNMINVGGYTPNLLLVLVFLFAFLYEDQMQALIFGAAAGLIYDLCYGVILGPTAISLLITALVVMLLRNHANIENIISMSVVAIIAFFFYYTLNWGLFRIAGINMGIGYALYHSLWPILYSLIITIIMYLFMIKKVAKHPRDRYFR